MTAQTPQLRRKISTNLHCDNMLYISIHPPDTTTRGFCLALYHFLFYLYTKWLIEAIKLPCLDYAIKKNEVKSNQSYYTHGMIECLFMSLVFLFTLFTEGQMDYKIVFNTGTADYNLVPRGSPNRQKKTEPTLYERFRP